jgi:hypothetical protein
MNRLTGICRALLINQSNALLLHKKNPHVAIKICIAPRWSLRKQIGCNSTLERVIKRNVVVNLWLGHAPMRADANHIGDDVFAPLLWGRIIRAV